MKGLASIRLAVSAALVVVLAACGATGSNGSAPSSSPSSTATVTPSPSATPLSAVSLYFLRSGKLTAVHRQVARGDSVGALAALMAGPSDSERSLGISTGIPSAARFLYVSWNGPSATVNLSHEFGSGSSGFDARLAQVVFTVTQFAPITSVTFQLDGSPITRLGDVALDHPVGRSDYEALAPAILIESPGIGDAVRTPITVTGTANTYEAVFQLQLLDPNQAVLVSQAVHATSGTGTRGTFTATLAPTSPSQGSATLRAFEYSAKDGSVINLVDVPISLTP